jgi:hypothetical protein
MLGSPRWGPRPLHPTGCASDLVTEATAKPTAATASTADLSTVVAAKFAEVDTCPAALLAALAVLARPGVTAVAASARLGPIITSRS